MTVPAPPPSSTDEASPAAAPKAALAPVLAQVQFYGLEHIEEDKVRKLLSTREWSYYSDEDMAADKAALLDTGWFTAVELKKVPLSDKAIRLDVRLTERPPAARTPAIRDSLPPPGAPDAVERAAAQMLGTSQEIPRPPWVLGKVEIEGNRNVKYNVIRAQIEAREGDLYTRADLDRDVKRVDKLGNFDRVAADISVLTDRAVPAHFASASASPHPIRLAFIVREKPLIRKILFEGRKGLSKGKLRDELELRKKDPFDRTMLREDADRLIALYRKKGYHRVGIETRVDTDTGTMKSAVTFVIDEGPKARIAAVRFKGVTAYKPKKLAKKMKNRRKKVYSAETMPEDLEKVARYYKDRGYIDFRVESSSVSFSKDLTKIYLDISVHEGPRHRFGETTFAGHTLYPTKELQEAVEYRKGKIFSQKRFDYTFENLQNLFAEKGRLRTQIDHEKVFDPKTKLMDVHFTIHEGAATYIDHVDVEGHKATKTHVFTRELLTKPGDLFIISRLRKSIQKIMNLGFIDDVQPDIQTPFDPNKADITYSITEGKPGMLTAGAGFSSLDGLVGTLSLQHMNLFGRAWRTGVQWSFGSRVNDFNISWTTPWIADRPISLGFDVFNTRRISPYQTSGAAFTNKRTGGSIRVGPRFKDDKYALTTRYTIQRVKIANVQDQFRDTLAEGTSIHSSIGLEFARDTRDNIWDPGEGSRHAIGMNMAGGPFMGDVHFWKPYMSNSYHHTLAKIGDYPLVFSVGNRAGYVTPFNKTKEVPVFERFFIGGQDSMRGYSVTGEVGARDGGKVYDVCNIELGFPLARERRRTIVKFVTFIDIGGSWENVRSMRMRVGTGQHDIKTDLGFGIRFTTPAFPIRLDWGYGLQHRPGEDRSQINFSIGPMF